MTVPMDPYVVVGVEVAAQVQVEDDAREHPEQDADEAAGCDPTKRLVGVWGEVEEEGHRHEHEEERRRPPCYVPDDHELVAQSKDLGYGAPDRRAGDQEQHANQRERREA